jgi:uncharacterized protein with HEPN domain
LRFERSVPDLLRDIVESIDDNTDFIGSMDYGAHVDSRITCAAVERKLMVVSEAAVRLGRGIEAACPTQDGRAIRGIGNVMRHHYEGVDDEVV